MPNDDFDGDVKESYDDLIAAATTVDELAKLGEMMDKDEELETKDARRLGKLLNERSQVIRSGADTTPPPDTNPPAGDDAAEEEKEQEGFAVDASDVDGVPYCRKHHVRMRRTSGGTGKKVYYKCPVEGCDARGQVIRTKVKKIVPQKVTICPRCKGDIVCERNERLSDAMKVILTCPGCSWNSGALTLPHVEAGRLATKSLANRRREPDLGER